MAFEKFEITNSSNVLRLEYDQVTEHVLVVFRDKDGAERATWEYWPVQLQDFELIRDAPSVGKAVSQYLVKGGLSSRKVSG